MTGLIFNIAAFAAGFVMIWFGAGLIVSSTSKFSKKLKLNPFIFSFVFLGLLTSTPEFSVGLNSLASNDPEIFVGNLLGGIIVLFLFVIPLLAVFGNGINVKHELDNKQLIATLLVIAAPAAFILDQKITMLEGGIFVVLYLALLYYVQRKKGIFDSENTAILDMKAYSYRDILKVILGLAIVFISSSLIVSKTIFFSDLLNISPFFIGLLVISLGTDLPEIMLAIRSVLSGKKEVAMGDYIGAAAASTLLFGVFTLLNRGELLTQDAFIVTFVFILGALSIFYFLSKRYGFISRRNGAIMICLYVSFLAIQLLRI